jgi:hypothetical protein
VLHTSPTSVGRVRARRTQPGDRLRSLLAIAITSALLALAVFGVVGCGGDDDTGAVGATGTTGAGGASSEAASDTASEELAAVAQDCAEDVADSSHSEWFDCMRSAGLECDPARCGTPEGDVSGADNLVTSDDYVNYCDVFPEDGQC